MSMYSELCALGQAIRPKQQPALKDFSSFQRFVLHSITDSGNTIRSICLLCVYVLCAMCILENNLKSLCEAIRAAVKSVEQMFESPSFSVIIC